MSPTESICRVLASRVTFGQAAAYTCLMSAAAIFTPKSAAFNSRLLASAASTQASGVSGDGVASGASSPSGVSALGV